MKLTEKAFDEIYRAKEKLREKADSENAGR